MHKASGGLPEAFRRPPRVLPEASEGLPDASFGSLSKSRTHLFGLPPLWALFADFCDLFNDPRNSEMLILS